MRNPISRSLAAAALLAALLATPAAAEPVGPDALVERTAPAIVTLKYVLKTEQWEHEYERAGTVVDPTGLVVLSNAYLSSGEVKVLNLRVLFGTDPKEWDAVLVARDSVLDLAYVQVLDVGAEKLKSVDLATAGEVRLGADLSSVWRDVRGFDFAPGIARHYVAGKVEKPRPMWSCGGDTLRPGLPVFDAQGRVVGIPVYQEGSSGADEENHAGGGSQVFLLGLSDVGKSLEAAKKRVPDAVAKAAEAKKEEKKEEKPPEPTEEKPDAPESPK